MGPARPRGCAAATAAAAANATVAVVGGRGGQRRRAVNQGEGYAALEGEGEGLDAGLG